MQTSCDRNRGYVRLPVMEEVGKEAERREVELVTAPTAEALELLNENPSDVNAVLHVTC